MATQSPVAAHWAKSPSDPPPEAFHVERVMDPFTRKECVGMVRHAGHAFVIPNDAPDLQIPDAVAHDFGVQYLAALAKALGFLPGRLGWIDANVWLALKQPSASPGMQFGWLNVNWGGPASEIHRVDRNGTLGSFWIDRTDGVGQANKALSAASPRLLVLVAGAVASGNCLQTGSDMGLRIVLQVHPKEVRIHGVTLSGLSHDRVLKAVPQLRQQDADIYDLLRSVKEEIGRALKVEGQLWITNLETSPTPGAPVHRLSATGFAMRWRKTAQSGPAAPTATKYPFADDTPTRARAYDFRVDVDVDPAAGGVQVVHVHRDAYVGSGARLGGYGAATVADVVDVADVNEQRAFLQDAASQAAPASNGTLRQRRPSRTDKALAAYTNNIGLGLAAHQALQVADAHGPLFEVRTARSGDGNLRGGSTIASTATGVAAVSPALRAKPDAVPDPVLRSDEHASIEAQVRAWDLFLRMHRYGIDANLYFRFARLPLVQRARPAMRWAPDGELPNAEVRPFLGDPQADGTRSAPKPSDRLQLLVKYGSADPMHRRKLPMLDAQSAPLAGRLKAQYLSVACDPRWAWHEFGHVLNFASTGELEFPFAHSAGDALAAIAADPLSAFAAGTDRDAPGRFATFPWIEVPGRSHGRKATRGYGWCGCRNLVRLNFGATLERYHHSYFGEQLLSSSLFRLYRSLGGDTRGDSHGDSHGDVRGDSSAAAEDEATRLAASDYCIYLIMRGISLLGPDTLAPARTPDQFVSALIEADLGTSTWNVQAVWPFNQAKPRTLHRQGGRVHKVIRWAFEQQGLYATADPQLTAEGTGLAPLVDVYIAAVGRAAGDYAPLALRVTGTHLPWHAHGDWLQRDGQRLTIQVGNRGQRAAQDTSVRVWWAKPTGGDPVHWMPLPGRAALHRVEEDQKTIFEHQLPAQAGKEPLWIFASADASADPSNVSDDSPPATWPGLMELVAHDNNLALAWR
jgi:hypothetical protein